MTSLAKDFIAFREQCIWLQTCYDTHSTIFDTGRETLNLLEKTAPAFFQDLQTILIEYFRIQVCKLTDPAKTHGRDNLTVKYLNVKLTQENLLTTEIRSCAEEIIKYGDLISQSRNRIACHSDKETILANVPIGEHTQGDIDRFFENLHRYVDSVSRALGVSPLDSGSTSGPGDALDLLRYLKSGWGAENDLVPHSIVVAVLQDGVSPIKAWREYLGLTQADIAERMGMSQSAYAQQESTTKTLGKASREKLTAALGITAAQLDV